MNSNMCYGRDSYFIQRYGLKKPDKFILRAFPEAEYYLSCEDWCLVFYRVDNEFRNDLENCTIIGDKVYKGTFTNTHDELIKFFALEEEQKQEKEEMEEKKEKEKNYEEITLF